MKELAQDVKNIWDELFSKYNNGEELTKEQKCLMVLAAQNKFLIEKTEIILSRFKEDHNENKKMITLLEELLKQIND